MTRITEMDPHGRPAHQAGAKLDANKTRAGLVIGGFARALLAVSEVGTFGARKYTPHGWVDVPDGVERYTDAMYRHLLAEAAGDKLDDDSGLQHAAHAAWCALARLDLLLRAQDAAVFPEIQPFPELQEDFGTCGNVGMA